MSEEKQNIELGRKVVAGMLTSLFLSAWAGVLWRVFRWVIEL